VNMIVLVLFPLNTFLCMFHVGDAFQARELLEGSKVLDWLTEHAEITYVPKQS
jgi:hypothetical protein